MGKTCLLSLGWLPTWWWCHNNNTFCGKCFITSSRPLARVFLWGLLKLWTIRLCETDLRRWTLELAVNNVDAHILAFSDLTCHRQGIGVGILSDCAVGCNQNELGSSDQELLYQEVKITGQFCSHVAHGSLSCQLFLVAWIMRCSLSVICFDK